MSPSEPLFPAQSGLRQAQEERLEAGSVTSSSATAGSASVAAELLYVLPDTPRGLLYMYPPPAGTPRLCGQYQARQMEIRDARQSAPEAQLDVHGFALSPHSSALLDAYDDAEVRSVYYPEMEQLVRSQTGAAEVLVFDHNLRSDVRARAGQAGVYEPVRRVHNDYTHVSAIRRIEQLLGADRAKLELERRLAIVNVWRPLFGPVQDTPLAVCDGQTIAERDLFAIDLLYRDRVGENFSVAYNPQHCWYYVPEMQANEALLLKCYDTADDGRCRFTAHSAFDHPHAPPGARPRESIEIRTLVFFDTPARAG